MIMCLLGSGGLRGEPLPPEVGESSTKKVQKGEPAQEERQRLTPALWDPALGVRSLGFGECWRHTDQGPAGELEKMLRKDLACIGHG